MSQTYSFAQLQSSTNNDITTMSTTLIDGNDLIKCEGTLIKY